MSEETKYIIEMRDIVKDFPGIRANDHVTVKLKKGEIHALLGENGVGKTTLLRLMCGLLFPNSGTCTVFEMESRKRLPDMLEKIYYYGKTYGKLYPNFNTEQFLYYLEKFNIDLKKKMKNLSHGQQKKSLIAFSLACNTPLLFLDEVLWSAHLCLMFTLCPTY